MTALKHQQAPLHLAPLHNVQVPPISRQRNCTKRYLAWVVGSKHSYRFNTHPK